MGSPFSLIGTVDLDKQRVLGRVKDNHMRLENVIYHRPPGLEGVELLHLTDPEFQFAPHMHDTYVFWFNAQGGERVSIGGSSAILQPDSFGVVAPGEIHANRAVTEHRTLESLYIDQAVLDDVSAQCDMPVGEFRSRLQRDSQSRQVLHQLHRLLLRENDEFLIRESLYSVFRMLLERHGAASVVSDKGRDPEKVQLARQIMSDESDSPLEIDELARRCGCSACHLIRLFRRETGITPHAYLMELRLGRAKMRLSSEGSLVGIAMKSGFTDQAHLTRRFRSRFGVTPGQYRKHIAR